MKLIVITGASSGIGLEISKVFLKKGWRVIGLARSAARLESIRDDLGREFIGIEVDVSLASKVKDVFEYIGANFGLIDILVNNAALFKMKKFSDSTIDDIDDVIDINLKGVMYCIHSAIKIMVRGTGKIINISSVAGEHGIREQSIYCASKFGLNGFGEALSQELIADGISLCTIAPGGVNTPLWNQENPYPGECEVSRLLSTNDLARLVEYVSEQPNNIILKKIIAFPSVEWH